MKANEAPEKIYVDSKAIGDDISTTVNTKRQDYPTCTEYTRTDAFVKKAKEAFCKATCNGHPPLSICTSLGTCREYDNFVKFLREE